MRLSGYCRLLAGFLLASLSVFGPAQGQDQVRQQHVGRVLDWSYHHVILSGGLPAADLKREKAEPRILFHLAERNLPQATANAGRQKFDREGRRPGPPLRPRASMKIDWSIPLGYGCCGAEHVPRQVRFRR
jgi:hypothetical protein